MRSYAKIRAGGQVTTCCREVSQVSSRWPLWELKGATAMMEGAGGHFGTSPSRDKVARVARVGAGTGDITSEIEGTARSLAFSPDGEARTG
eukprot:6209543-Pleurochrysis_carterae.AAC.1